MDYIYWLLGYSSEDIQNNNILNNDEEDTYKEIEIKNDFVKNKRIEIENDIDELKKQKLVKSRKGIIEGLLLN